MEQKSKRLTKMIIFTFAILLMIPTTGHGGASIMLWGVSGTLHETHESGNNEETFWDMKSTVMFQHGHHKALISKPVIQVPQCKIQFF